MKVYVSHASSFDYHNELYAPLEAIQLRSETQFVFPHQSSADGEYAKDIIKSCDIVFAEVSYPSTGQGIELGWAESYGLEVITIAKTAANIPTAIRFISNHTYRYSSTQELQALAQKLVAYL